MFTGSGTSITPFFSSKGGLLTVAGTYQADDSLVKINLRDSKGRFVEEIANQSDTFIGSKGVKVKPGIYFVELEGDGAWSVAVE